MNENKKSSYWPMLPAAIALAGVIVFIFATFGPPASSSGFVSTLKGFLNYFAPDYVASKMHYQMIPGPGSWLMSFVIGMAIGGFAAGITFPEKADDIPKIWRDRFGDSRLKRYGATFAGGFLILFSSRLAGGCTLGLFISGSTQMAVSGLYFGLIIFVVAMLTARLIYGSRDELEGRIMTDVFLGLFAGIFFGFIIQRVGATNPHKMARAHLMIEPAIPQFMLLAVVFSAIGLVGLQSVGVGSTVILPTSILATGIAAVIFGIGWGLAGYCPGTCWAAMGEGRLDALFAFLGGLTGAAVFAHYHERIIPRIYDPTNIGQLTLGNITGNRFVGLLFLAILFSGAIWAIGRFWRNDAE